MLLIGLLAVNIRSVLIPDIYDAQAFAKTSVFPSSRSLNLQLVCFSLSVANGARARQNSVSAICAPALRRLFSNPNGDWFSLEFVWKGVGGPYSWADLEHFNHVLLILGLFLVLQDFSTLSYVISHGTL